MQFLLSKYDKFNVQFHIFIFHYLSLYLAKNLHYVCLGLVCVWLNGISTDQGKAIICTRPCTSSHTPIISCVSHGTNVWNEKIRLAPVGFRQSSWPPWPGALPLNPSGETMHPLLGWPYAPPPNLTPGSITGQPNLCRPSHKVKELGVCWYSCLWNK